DDEVKNILKDCYKEAKKLLKDNRKVMDKIAARLIKQETITGKEFMQIFRKEKGLPEPDDKASKKKEKDAEKNKAKDDVTAITVMIDGEEEEIDLEKAYHQNKPDQQKKLSDDANSHTRFEAVVDDEKVKATSVREFTIIPAPKNEPKEESGPKPDLVDMKKENPDYATPPEDDEEEEVSFGKRSDNIALTGEEEAEKKDDAAANAKADMQKNESNALLEKRFSEGAKLLDDLAATADLGEDDE
ncbi:MAG: hypothetical protein IK078_05660, partial [Lachnospiraceae bacterium]|nr:hypothetical protein [Lachnospiraceae bacterium]